MGGKRCGENKSCNQRAVSGASPWRQHGGRGAGGRARLAPRCSPLRGAGLQAEWTAKPGARTQKRGPPARGARHGDFIPEPPAAPAPSEHQARVLCSLLTLKIFRKLKGTALHPHGLGSGAPTSQRATPPPAIGPCHVSPAPSQGPRPGQGAPSSAAPDCAAQPLRPRTTHSSNKNAPRMFRASCFSRGAGSTLPQQERGRGPLGFLKPQ